MLVNALRTGSAFLALAALTACGDATPSERDFGSPPDAGFDPGRGGGGDGYGSGSGAGGGGPGAGVVPAVCPEELKRCPVEVTFPAGSESAVELRGDWGAPDTWTQGLPMARSGTSWRVTAPWPPGKPVNYKFCIDPRADGTCVDWRVDPSKPTAGSGPTQNNVLASVACSAAVCEEPPVPPAGVFDWRDAVIYFAFVDRFLDGDPTNNCNVAGVDGPPGNYQGGDWKGITQKIASGYFATLGVNTLWLTVPMENAKERGKGVSGDDHFYSAYHGYWPKELNRTEPCFGSRQDLLDLIAAAHGKKMKVLFDYAMVHLHATASTYRDHPDWFWPNRNAAGTSSCICGDTCDWEADGKRCWFTDYLPHWNYTVNSARDFSVANAVQWVKDTGIDGYRLDAIKHVDDSWLTQLRAQINTEVTAAQTPKQRFYMVGETFTYDRNALRSYIDPATKLDGQFDFPVRLQLARNVLARRGTMAELRDFYDANDTAYGASTVMSPFVGNHDLGRAVHMAEDAPKWDDWSNGDKANAWTMTPAQPAYRRPYERMGVAFAVLFTNRGAPLLYYGDEVALAGAGDPDNRRFFPWNTLSADQTWLQARVAKLIAIRNAHPALRRGRRTTLATMNDLWAYAMSTAGDTVYVAVNRGDAQDTATGLPAGALEELVEGGAATGPDVAIPPRSARVFITK